MDEVFLALRVVASLAIVLGTIVYAWKRISRGQTASKKHNPINIVSRQGVSGKASVVIVEADGHRFVLGITEQSVNVMHSTKLTPELTPAQTFARLLSASDQDQTLLDAAELTAPSDQPAVTLTHSPIAGSILSPDTWKRASAALRQGLAR